MTRDIPPKPRQDSGLASDLKAFLLKRDRTAPETSSREKPKHLNIQVLMTELENILATMDQADARVQRTLAKLHELKIAIMIETNKD